MKTPEWIIILTWRFMGFSVIGMVSTVVSMLMFYVGVEMLHYKAVGVYLGSYILTIIGSYFANSIWVFHAKVSAVECVKFFGIYASGMFLGAALLRLLEFIFPMISPFLLGIGAMPITVGWNFFFVNYIMERFEHRKR